MKSLHEMQQLPKVLSFLTNEELEALLKDNNLLEVVASSLVPSEFQSTGQTEKLIMDEEK